MRQLSLLEKKVLAEFKRQVHSTAGNQADLILFGSRARSQSNEDSDIDILVLVNERTPNIRNTIIDIAHDLFLEYEIEISPFVLSREQFEKIQKRERLIGREIKQDGVSL